MADSRSDHTSTHALQELDQVISKLQKVLQLENEQHLQEILSKMPADYLTSERLIAMADHLPSQISGNAVSPPDGKTILSSDHAIEAGKVQNRNKGHGGSVEEVKPEVPKLKNPDDQKTSHCDDSKVLQDRPLQNNHQDLEKPRKHDFSDPGNSRQARTKAASSSASNTSSDAPTRNETTFDQSLQMKNLLLSIRQDVISLQKDIYSQIMNSLLEYKIVLYKNLLRAGLDVSCPEQSSKKANHKNFMLIRKLQQMIAKSSESNFESWYKFYSYSVFPKTRDVVGKIDSVAKSTEGPAFEAHRPKRMTSGSVSDLWTRNLNDDFFVRAGDPHVEPADTVEAVAKGGFDWKNLDQKIRESMRNVLKRGRPKNSEGNIREEKGKGDGGERRNFVEIGKDVEHKKDKHDKNNLKGDFRKRKVSEREHKKHKHLDKTKNHRQEENEQSKRKWGERAHDETDKQEMHEHNKHNYRQGGQKHEKKDHRHEKREHHEKNKRYEKSSKNFHENRKHEEPGKKYKHEGKERHDKHEHKYRKHDKSKSYESEESKHHHKHGREESKHRHKHGRDKRSFDESASSAYDEYVKNVNDEYRKADAGRNTEDNNYDEDFESKGGKFEHKRDDDYRGGKNYRGQYKDKKKWRKMSYSDVGKYVKNAASGLWKTVKEGYKNVKDYGESYVKDWRSRKPKETGKYEDWRKEFVKEMKDVIRVLGGNPTLASLSEVPKSVSRFFGDGLSSVMGSFEWEEKSEKGPEGLRPGPEGMKEESMCYDDGVCEEEGEDQEEEEATNGDDNQWSKASEEDTADEGYESSGHKTSETPYSDGPNHRGTEPSGRNTGSWYYDVAKHRADARRNPGYPRVSDSSWFLGLGRHRAYLRRRGIHLDDDGSWFISSAKHRAKMRQKHMASPNSPYFYSQASSKR